MSISKQVIDAGLTQFYPVIVLSDEFHNVILDRNDYSDLVLNEGMTDAEIMEFAGVL
ncbi:MAG: hypothetical protein M0R00_08380 [Candidatus Omnitrophica bacterium]|jgi:hypothetical protein|nr:hypothetical protein [Candidatus Omnitrophota bacterium]